MTSPTPPYGRPAATGLPLRLLTAWTLLALAGVNVFFGFLAWVFPPSRTDFFGRFSVDSFTGTVVLVAPLLAALVAARIGTPLPQAKLVSLLALAVYAGALGLGGLAFLITFASRFDGLESGIYVFGGVLQRLGGILETLLRLGLLTLALLWTYRIFTSLGGRLPRLDVQVD